MSLDSSETRIWACKLGHQSSWIPSDLGGQVGMLSPGAVGKGSALKIMTNFLFFFAFMEVMSTYLCTKFTTLGSKKILDKRRKKVTKKLMALYFYRPRGAPNVLDPATGY